MNTTRQEKVRAFLIEEVSDILRREMRDPRIGFVTVTDAEITVDMRFARIYVSVLGDDEEKKSNMAALKNAQGYIRQTLGKRWHSKILPDLEFKLDTTADRCARISELLWKLKDENERPIA